MRIRQLVPALLLLVLTAFAQQLPNSVNTSPIVAVRMINRAPSSGISRHYIRIDLASKVVPSTLALGNVIVTFEPSGSPVPDIASVGALPGNPTVLEILFSSDVPSTVPLGDTAIKVTFNTFVVSGPAGKPQVDVSAQGKIYDDANIGTLKDDALKKLSQGVASSKTQDEKNAFSGFNIVLPSAGNSAEGQADIALNKTLYAGATNAPSLFDELDLALQLKKASEDTADAKHFDGGFRFRKTILFASDAELSSIRSAVLSSSPESIDAALQSIGTLRKRFFRALLLDDKMSFEGDVQGAAIGNVGNVVNDFSPQITTINRPIAEAGYWNFRILPIGAELGYNVNDAADPQMKNKSITRLKSGAEINVFYDNPGAIPNKVELTTSVVNRYLFNSEAAWDATQGKAVLTTKGDKYWVQTDFKVFFVKALSGNAGLKLTFQRGFLPPVYAFDKAFNFGLVFETNDNDTTDSTKLK
jgi:hypothetical protein